MGSEITSTRNNILALTFAGCAERRELFGLTHSLLLVKQRLKNANKLKQVQNGRLLKHLAHFLVHDRYTVDVN